MKEVVFCLEERSAKEMLEGIVGRIFSDQAQVRYIVFNGKQDLHKQLPGKLRRYANPYANFVVLQDLDRDPDCRQLKDKLLQLCQQGGRPNALIRLACKELESFYLADLAAVEAGLNLTGLIGQQGKQKFRRPDDLGSPAQELIQLTKGRYQKVGGSRAIGPHLDLENTRSTSFRNLIHGLRRLA